MKLTFCAATFALIGAAATAGNVTPTEVTYDEYGAIAESLTGQAGDPQLGAEIVSTKSKGNCVACHAVTALQDVPWHGEVGPTLDGVADRWGAAELRGIVANAKMTYDGTVMPAFYKTEGFVRPGDAYTGKAPSGPLDPILTAQEIEDVVAFLLTLKE
ncbi:MAG: sulfur oxidation c-type cytochrome SoxX [Mangrovicoccus sp.]